MNPRMVIVVTSTYVRTFQLLHLTGVMHSLMLVPYDLVWIVGEAGGVSNETASLIAKSGLKTIHVGFNQRMSNSWEERHKLESKMRFRALRSIREKKLDGIVMFAGDRKMFSMELFDEIQNVKWFGAVSVGMLTHSVNTDEMANQKKDEEENPRIAVYIDDRATLLPRKMEWSGFILNSRLLWKDNSDKSKWIKDIDMFNGDIESPLGFVNDPLVVEPLGNCDRQVLLWWLQVEARVDSKFPSIWIIYPPLEITVSSKRTPWPDAQPELPVNEKPAMGIQDPIVKHSTKRTSRSKH
ncbi:hypothetical protein V6Z11_D08G049800 [Gossypium hirsutum]